ncbi:galactokinase [Actinomycetota bacterium]
MPDASAIHESRFGVSATVVVNSPGRINLIGEHTDYCGLPVLPMAIRQGIQIAASESAQPGLAAVSTLDDVVISSMGAGERRGWAKYVLAVLDEVGPAAADRGARLAIDGDLPATGGLSSSSALAVGCVIALSELWDLALSPQEIVAGSMAAEQSAAIAGGAMDQTVITLARPGHALRIEFDPPSHRHIPMPDDFTWVAGYSGTRAAKGESAATAYNSFVLTSRAAAAVLAEQLGRDAGTPPLLSKVGDASPDQIAALRPMTVEAAAAITGGDSLGLEPGGTLNLRISAEHVLSEAARVDAAERALAAADRAELGRLMNASHASLEIYGASTDSLDALVTAAREAGAAGARLTGAGFGGWAIALTSPTNADAVREAMETIGGGPTLIAQAGGGALWSLHGP